MVEGENIVMKDFDSIDAELGDNHVLRLVSLLSHDTPRSQEGLVQLHQECLEIFSKYPHGRQPSISTSEVERNLSSSKKSPPKRTASQGNQLKPTDIANRIVRERPQMIAQHPPTSKPQIVIEMSRSNSVTSN